MAENKGSSAFEVAVSFVIGAATGFILGILFAPASGRETRQKIKQEAAKVGEKAKEFAKEADKGIRIVKEKTQEGMGVIKDYLDRKREDLARKISSPGADEARTKK